MNPDTLVYEVDPRVGFWVADRVGWLRGRVRTARAEWEKLVRQVEELRIRNPQLFDQLLVLGVAACLEVLASYLKRR